MNTRELAKKLGALEIITVESQNSKSSKQKQPFDFLLVLDFEATCWDQTSKRTQSEIIEFPVVLYDVKNDEIVSEFQQYVRPTEHPKLSDFCIGLTGIQQTQVDNGISLQVCLLLFDKWLNDKKRLYNMEFPSSDNSLLASKTCAFATWSNWDLGTCLKRECNRKKIGYNKAFKKWIDVRQIFKMYFRRPFTGLNGALSELGLTFEGTEHCGLHDARNTARLIGKMIENGVMLQLTRY